MGDKSAILFISNLNDFYKFYNSLNIKEEKKKEEKKEEIKIINKFKNNIYVFTGIRDKDLEKIIVDSGGKISKTVSNKTTALIVKTYNDNTVKVKTAKELKIPIIEYSEFIK